MNKNTIKKIILPFILMIIFNLGTYYFTMGRNFGEGFAPHLGIIFISGLLFGPYGALGSVLGNTICDMVRGYHIGLTVTSEIVSLGISMLAYKLWYENFKSRKIITKPKLSDTTQMMVFIGIIIFCAAIYALVNKKLFYIFHPETMPISFLVGIRYFINFVNSAFLFGIIGIWISKYIDFTHTPEIYVKKFNKKIYAIVGGLLLISTIIIAILDFYGDPIQPIMIAEIIIISGLLFFYLTNPITGKIKEAYYNTIPEKIMNIFLIATIMILIISYIIASDEILIGTIDFLLPISVDEAMVLIFILMDIMFIIFFAPSLFVLNYIEKNVINPLVSFSEIEKFIKKGDTIESEKLIEVYSKYINEEDEIGMLARSYTDLINYTNEYIENIHEIEGEKQRIEAELNIAERIQASNLPTERIENEDYSVFGFSQPAKEVGGDFYDYYELDDDNIAIVIGDASGKGVPAALLSTITQAIIRQILKTEKDPSKVLYSVNNQLCENNSEYMFITLWLGIYNKKTKIMTFSNAGHNPPIVFENENAEELITGKGIVLGVMEDFEFAKEEIPITKGIVLYTDGITDAKDMDKKFYGEQRLIEFINNNEFDEDIITKLLKDISEFTKGTDQFDDMTILILERKT